MNKVIKKTLIGLGIVLVTIVAVITLTPLRYLFAPEFMRPYHGASQKYLDKVEAFDPSPISDKEDLYSRYEIIADFFERGLTSADYEGKQAEVTLEDMHTLLNQPNDTIKNPQVSNTDTVYQYHLEDTTVHLHAQSDIINEILYEEVSGQTYNQQDLDAIFLAAVQKAANANTNNYDTNTYAELVDEAVPTRMVRTAGWNMPLYNLQHFYDDGQSDKGPEEFVVMNFEGQDEDNDLKSITRRYRQAFDQLDDSAQIDEQMAFLTELDGTGTGDSLEEVTSLYIRDYTEALGDSYTMSYDVRTKKLQVSWFVKDENDSLDKVTAIVSESDIQGLSNLDDLGDLPVNEAEITYTNEDELYAIPNSFIAK